MTKRRIILASVVFFSLMVFTVQTLPQARSSNRTTRAADAERRRGMTDAERKREFAKWRERRKLEREQKRKEWEKQKEEAGGFIYEKFALGATEEQWKLVRAKLEKVQNLRFRARSTVGLFLTSSSSSGTMSRDSRSRNVPSWQWDKSWKGKAPSELTEAQKLTKQLIVLVERKNTTPQAFRRKMAALRKARSEEAELKRQLSEARRELCEMLTTTRQEAALVLMGRL